MTTPTPTTPTGSTSTGGAPATDPRPAAEEPHAELISDQPARVEQVEPPVDGQLDAQLAGRGGLDGGDGHRDTPLPPARAARPMLAMGAMWMLMLAWALWPLRDAAPRAAAPDIEATPASPDATDHEGAAIASTDWTAFSLPLWVAPPAPPEPPARAEPAPIAALPPLSAQLVAVVRRAGEGGVGGGERSDSLAAVFFDPASQRLVEVAAGQAIEGRTVERVEPDRVILREGVAGVGAVGGVGVDVPTRAIRLREPVVDDAGLLRVVRQPPTGGAP